MPNEEPKVTLTAIGLANYRSFDATGFCLRTQPRATALVGKNNSGKSNVLRALELLNQIARNTVHVTSLDVHRRAQPEGCAPRVVLRIHTESLFVTNQSRSTWVSKDELRTALSDELEIRWDAPGGVFLWPEHVKKLSPKFAFAFVEFASPYTFNSQPPTVDSLNQLVRVVSNRASVALRETLDNLILIPENRRMGSAAPDGRQDVFDGRSIIKQLRSMQSPLLGREDEEERFNEVERFTRDLLGDHELKLRVLTDEDRIVVTSNGLRLPLEHYGTGIHQLVLLCCALAIHKNALILIEEPELNLHPDLQRKLLRFMLSLKTNRYILTTHSNVFLDRDLGVYPYHVTHDGSASRVTEVRESDATRGLLAEMGYKASDLIQANGVIWVEGPSDRTYLKAWLKLVAPHLVEGLHFSIMFFGGCGQLAHLGEESDEAEGLIGLRSINPNVFVLIDSDRGSEADSLKPDVERIERALAGDCWVTQGREVENYLSDATLSRGLKEDPNAVLKLEPYDDLTGKLRGILAYKGGLGKVKVANRFAPEITAEDLDTLDLRERLAALVSKIYEWNHMKPPNAN